MTCSGNIKNVFEDREEHSCLKDNNETSARVELELTLAGLSPFPADPIENRLKLLGNFFNNNPLALSGVDSERSGRTASVVFNKNGTGF